MCHLDEAKETVPVYSAKAESAIELVLKPSFLHIYLSLRRSEVLKRWAVIKVCLWLQPILFVVVDEAKGISAFTSPVHHTTNCRVHKHMNPVNLNQSS